MLHEVSSGVLPYRLGSPRSLQSPGLEGAEARGLGAQPGLGGSRHPSCAAREPRRGGGESTARPPSGDRPRISQRGGRGEQKSASASAGGGPSPGTAPGSRRRKRDPSRGLRDGKTKTFARVLEPVTKAGLPVCTAGITPTWPSWGSVAGTQETRGQRRFLCQDPPSAFYVRGTRPQGTRTGDRETSARGGFRVWWGSVRPLATEAGGRLRVACTIGAHRRWPRWDQGSPDPPRAR